MSKKSQIILLLLMINWYVKAQNPANITMPNPTPNPPNLAADSYTRAVTSINLQATQQVSFKYGAVTAGATNLLNLNLSTYPNYVNNNYVNPAANPNYHNPNPNLEVGTIEGVANVSPIGAFQYNFPIQCSPGTAGMQPDLSIVYNSNGGNGCVGLGFNISGISAISRTGKSVFYDGLNSGVNFNSSDVFALDGERMLLKSGSYGQPNAKYKFEVENYNDVVSIGTSGVGSTGPQYFIINTRGGKTIEYGNTIDSRNTAKNSTDVLSWCINKITDEHGNYMTYHYLNVDGEILLDKIEYTGNGNLAPYNKISFTYMNRSDNNSIFISGKEFSRTKILKRIICEDINHHAVRTYEFEYDYNFASLLNKVTEVDALGNTLNPTFISWENLFNSKNTNGLAGNVFPQSQEVIRTVAADMNGDGFQDLLCIRDSSAPFVDIKFNSQNGSGVCNGCLNFNSSANSNNISNKVLSNTPADIIGVYVFDEDQDNIDEVFFIVSKAVQFNGGSMNSYEVLKLKGNGTVFSITTEVPAFIEPQTLKWQSWRNINIWPQYRNASGFLFQKVDVSGDNLNDVIFVSEFQISITPSNGQAQFVMPLQNFIKASAGDFNGDGVAEIYILKENPSTTNAFIVEVYKYDTNTNSLILLASTGGNISVNPSVINWHGININVELMANFSKSIDFGDVNGDGKTDIFYGGYISNIIDIHTILSDGLVFMPAQNNLTIPSTLNGYESTFFLADVNSDGKADLVVSSYDSNSKSTNFTHYPSIGNTFAINPAIFSCSGQYMTAMGDFDGDGALDYHHQLDFTNAYFSGNMFSANLKIVKEISNLKSDIRLDYWFLPSAAMKRNVANAVAGRYGYNKTTTANPNTFKIFTPRLFVVHSAVSNGKKIIYGYENGLMHRESKGFLGFERFYNYNENLPVNNGSYHLGSVTSVVYDGNLDYVTSTETKTGAFQYSFNLQSAYITGKSTTNVSFINSGTNRYLYSTTSVEKNYLNSINSTTSTNFDNANGGNVLYTATSSNPWLGGAPLSSGSKIYTYITNTHPVYGTPINRILKETSVVGSAGGAIQFYTDYVYNGANLSSKTYQNPTQTNSIVTTHYSQYNNFGKPTSIVISASDLAQPRSSVLQYDATGRFITKTTNAIGNSEEFIYDPGLGNKLQVKDISGLITSYQYDGLGRMIKATLPSGAINTVSYQWYSYPTPNVNPNGYAIKIIKNIEGLSSSTTFYDNRDNVVKTQETGFAGNTEIANYIYDILDRLTLKEEAHYQNQTAFKSITYTFDDYSRSYAIKEYLNQNLVTNVDFTFNNLSTDINYKKGFTTTKTPRSGGNGFVYSTKENNEAGQEDKVMNYDNPNQTNTASYHFNVFGKPDQITTSFPGGSGGAITTLQYDDFGRKIQINDPTAGIHTYKYNSIGELMEQTNPSGTYKFTYDLLGRLLTKVNLNNSYSYNYLYVTAPNGRQQIGKITGSDVTTEFAYDAFSRLSEKKETITSSGNKILKTNYSYNKYNQLIDYTYPSGFKTTNEYDALGNLIKIKNNNTVIWELTSLQTPNLINQFKYNNGLLTNSYAYDNNQNLAQRNYGTILQQSYTLAPENGDLMRQEFIQQPGNVSNNEQFQFDEFDRLVDTKYVDANNNLTPKANVSYYPNGNINTKSDAGSYVYGQQGSPYKLTQINGPNNINVNTLNITYTDFKKVSSISESVTNKQMLFTYGNDEERIKMEYKVSGVTQYSRFYTDNFDRQETGASYKEWNYIYAPTGLCAIYYNNNGTAQLNYVLTEQNGSPVALLNNQNVILEQYSFDPWGRRRDPANWNNFNLAVLPSLMIRGYTMHEMLDEFGIINMNGRIYDPILGRFLQPDNYIQAPDNLQSFNRYAYCWNNPLKYTDPSGNFTWNDAAAIGLIVGGTVLALSSGAVTYFTGGASAPVSMLGIQIGGSMVLAGIAHFGFAFADHQNNGTNWNTASNNAGINISVNITPNWGNNKSNQRQQNQVNYEKAESLAPGYSNPTEVLYANAKGGPDLSIDQSGGGESAANSEFTMRGDDVNFITLFNEFLTGTGPEYSGFGQDHPMTKDMQKSLIVTMATMKYMAGGGKPLRNYDVPFSLASIPFASQSMTEQFVGGARVSIIPTSIGTVFIVNNSTGWYSASYHTGNDIYRSPGQTTPYGTIYQRFMWIQK